MYIIKNALKSLRYSIGRNLLIGIIITVIAVTACIGLSIRQAAENAKKETMSGLSVTAQISLDMQSMMGNAFGEGGFDRDNFKENFGKLEGLDLEELKTYAKAESVSDFYYTLTLSLNGTDEFEAVSTTTESEDGEDRDSNGGFGGFGGGMPQMSGGKGGMFRSSSDFTLIGYSSEKAMTDFIDGNSSISDGECFKEGTENLDCIISEELATYNDTQIGDTITLVNPENEEETYALKVVGFYSSESSSSDSMPGFSKGFGGATDPTNQIFLSAAAAQKISDASSALATDDSSSAVYSSISGTYVFESVEKYESFEDEARELGLSEEYQISSSDINAYEQSLVPLESLSETAKYFLIVILVIGAIILVVFNIFSIRERKYEVGVLTAIGMKKQKVAMQFLCEVFVVTFLSVIIGGGIGAVSSVPVTNALLENQITAQSQSAERTEQSFGRPGMPGGDSGMPTPPSGSGGGFGGFGGGGLNFSEFGEQTAEYVKQIDSATDLTVLLKLCGIGLLLTLCASGVSVIFIMRYDPLKILANRD